MYIIEDKDLAKQGDVPHYATNRRERLMDKLNLINVRQVKMQEVQGIIHQQ